MSYYIGATGEYIWEELLENTTSNVVISNNINFNAGPLTDAIQQTITDALGTAVGELIQTPTQVASATGVGVISLTALGLLSYYKLNRTAVQDVDSMVYSADYASILTPGMFDDRVRIRYDNNWFSNSFYYVDGVKKGEILTYRPEQGSNILNLDATNIKLGTINNTRLPQNYGLKLGIGTTPVATTDLHVYNATTANLLLETGGAGTASIDFQRGTISDVNVDFRIISDAGRLKILSQDEVNLYTATTSEIVRYTRTLMTNYKDLYNVGNVSIGLQPDATYPSQLRVYNSTNTILRLETDTTGKASIEFQRGAFNDANVDYRIINESDLFKIQSQNATNLYTAGTMELMRISPTLTTNYKDFTNNGAFNNLGNVNLSTTAGTSSYKLNVEGDVNIAGIGKKFYVNNTPVVSSQWNTSGTTIEYTTGSVGIGTDASTYKLNVWGTINANGLITCAGLTSSALITANNGITIATGQTLTLSGTAGITAGGLITANGGITTSATSLITANNGITIATGKTLTLSGTSGMTAGGLITANGGITIATGQTLTLSGTANISANTMTASGLITASTITASGLITANNGIVASTIKTTGGGLLSLATSTSGSSRIGTNDSTLGVATNIVLCSYFHPTYPSCILHTTERETVGHHIFSTVASGFIDERFRIWSNGAVGIQKPNTSSTPGGQGGYAIYNNYMAGGTLTIGNIGQDYGGGNNWTANTAGFMMECKDNTEIVIHDSGNSLHSFMRYTTNGNFRIGRNMGYGNGNVSISGYLEVDGSILSKNAVYARNSYDAVMYCDGGGMYLKFGTLNTANSDYLEISASNGATNINSNSNRAIYLRQYGYTSTFLGGFTQNGGNSLYWNTISDHRVKENIKKSNLQTCYDNVKNINLYRYNYINGFNDKIKDKTQLGFIAQQVHQHFPKSVSREKIRIEDKREIPDLANIDIGQVNFTLFGAVKQLMKVVEKQSKRIKKLEEMLGIIDDDVVDNDADEPYERIVCDEVDIDDIEPSEPMGV